MNGRGAGARTQNRGFGDLRDTVSPRPYGHPFGVHFKFEIAHKTIQELLRLLVHCVLCAPLAMLLLFETVLVQLLILLCVIIYTLTLGALEFDEIVLGHSFDTFDI